ncbi:hypothetical protein VTO42DRAFT_3885 [Malbranchea cinnamomea]
MSSFFTLPRKRKREDGASGASKKRGTGASEAAERKHKRKERDESISGSESEEEDVSEISEASEDEGSLASDEDETAAERRLRLAERYLENVREEVDEIGYDAAEIDRDLIAERLKEDVDEAKGRLYRQIASQLSYSSASHSFFRADTQTTTAVAIYPPYVYTVSKDKTLIKWELATPSPKKDTQESNSGSTRPPRPQRKKPKKIKQVRGLVKSAEGGERLGHTGNILTVAVSPSGRFLATGGADKRLVIWDAETLTPMKVFTQHRDSVSGLSFTRHISSSATGEQLFSASFDRTIKTWSLSTGGHAYVETLFGHQDHVISVSSMATDQCVSVGARDRTARLWKVVDETQLVFRGGSSKTAQYAENSIDCVAVIPPTHFVTGSDSGDISLWSVHKKKPLHTIHQAHGLDPLPPLDDLSSEQDHKVASHNIRNLRQTPRWITALATLPGTDIVLSGSWDGWIRAWQISEDKRRIIPLGPVGGHDSTAPVLPKKLQFDDSGEPKASEDAMDTNDSTQRPQQQQQQPEPPLNGIVNGIAVFERRGPETTKLGTEPKPKSKSAKSPSAAPPGLCIVVALGKEHRLGRWKVFNSLDRQNNGGGNAGGRNGAVVFEVPFSASVEGPVVNGSS